MADYRIKAQKQPPRTYKKELQLISYAGTSLYNEAGAVLLGEKDVYYPPDYSKEGSVAVNVNSESYRTQGFSSQNSFSKGKPAALPIEEQFPLQSEVSRSLLGINRAETQQGIFGNVSSYGLDKKDWVSYAFFPDDNQANHWQNKNSPAGAHKAAIDYDYASGSAVVLSSYAVPYYNPGNPVLERYQTGNAGGALPASAGRYIQGLIAMYIIEHMVNNFTDAEKDRFNVSYIDNFYPKTSSGEFDRLYWDRIWTDIDQSRIPDSAIPTIPLGELRNFGDSDASETTTIDLTDSTWNSAFDDADLEEVDIFPGKLFFASTRYTWEEPDKGHYRLKTNDNADLWQEYWGIDYDSLPTDLKNWEFRVLESEPSSTSPEVKYKLPYYLITDKSTAYSSLIFGSDWPKTQSDDRLAEIGNKLTDGNSIGSRPSSYSGVFLQSQRAFRYQPGRISGFTYGVRVSEEGAGPGTILEFGVENFSDGYFFRFKDGTDFSIIRRSTVPLGTTDLFEDALYTERETYINRITGIPFYADELTQAEIDSFESDLGSDGSYYKVYELEISQRIMNGDPINSQGDSGYIYNPDTVTMYKIEFGWYGAIGARFYAYIPQENGEGRWVTLHTLVIENQIGEPCLQDPFFFFKYRVFVKSPNVLKLPQFVEKYGASYYIDGGDEGTVKIESGSASGRFIPEVTTADFPPTTTEFPINKWGTVIGIKSKKDIVNNEGTVLPNKKEIFPVSASIYSTRDTELKFVNQFGCQENCYTFQESFRCNVAESQVYRGLFNINRLQQSSSILAALGRSDTDPVPTIEYVGRVSSTTYPDSYDNLPEASSWTTWNLNQGALIGSHIIADKVYGAYVNPEQQYRSSPTGISNTEAILQRKADGPSVFAGSYKDLSWNDGALLFRYKDENNAAVDIEAKLSNFRKDTTLVSTVDIETDEFFIFYTQRGGKSYDTVQAASTGSSPQPCSQGAPGCDYKHVADYQLGIFYPRDIASEDPSSGGTFTYPESLLARSNTGPDFGILNPANTAAQGHTWTNEPIELVQNSDSEWAVKDKQNPQPDEYMYYEGLPVDFEDPALETNVILLNQSGRVNTSADGFEVNERYWDYLGEINRQLPGVPGEDGGGCRAIFCKAEKVEKSATIDIQGSTIYLSSDTRWDAEAQIVGFTINLVNSSTDATIGFVSSAGRQVTSVGAGNRILYKLPVTNPNSLTLTNNTSVVASYGALSAYETSLITKTGSLITKKIIPATAFPYRTFIRFKDNAEVGSVIIGKVTSNGIVQLPFTPHGCTLSVGTGSTADTHDAGSNGDNAATKHIRVFSHPGTLSETLNYSFYDVRNGTTGGDPEDRSKKCTSFVSKTILSGAGFSGVGDYPLRFLKFKDSGDPVGSFFISKDTPTEISLKELFNVSAESIGPTFWNNKALFMIARDANLDAEAGTGRMSVTINYKEQ